MSRQCPCTTPRGVARVRPKASYHGNLGDSPSSLAKTRLLGVAVHTVPDEPGQPGAGESQDASRAVVPAPETSTQLRAWHVLLYILGGVVVAALSQLVGLPWLIGLLIAPVVSLPRWFAGDQITSQFSPPARPIEPVEHQPKRRHVGLEPPSQVHVLADHCAICGRALSNPQSRQAGVGMECIKTWGPRPAYAPNPAHEAWRAKMAAADADLAVARGVAKAEYQRALEAFPSRLAEWEESMQAPEMATIIERHTEGTLIKRAARRGGAVAALSYAVAALLI